MENKYKKRKKWFDVSKRGKSHAILFVDAIGLTMNTDILKKITDIDYKVKDYRQFDNKRSIGYEDYKNIVNIMNVILEKNPEIYYEIFNHMENTGNEIVKWTDENKNIKFKSLKSLELLDLIIQIVEFQKNLWIGPFIYSYYFYFNDIFLEQFISNLKNKNILDGKLLNYIQNPKDLTSIGKEKLNLLKIAKDYFKQKIINDNKIINHWEKYAYLNRYYYWGEGFSLDEIKKRFNELINKGENYVTNELDNLKTESINLDDYNLNEYEKRIIKLAKKASYAMNYADEVINYSIHHLKPAFNELASRLGLDYNKIVSMRLSEIVESVKNNKPVVSLNELTKRLEDHALIFTNGESIVLIENELDAYRKNQIKEDVDKNINELKGTVAFSSKEKIIGRARIINSTDYIKNFLADEILVTEMTNPTYVPIMEKAKAIITNEGGLLCHAAIISRELKVPCIIGTKIATKVLHDGDLVEVDADKGVVKVLERVK